MVILRFKQVAASPIPLLIADSDYGRYTIIERGNQFHVRRNGRLIHTAGYVEAATGQAQIDAEYRERRAELRAKARKPQQIWS
jgi:hypothetical protein